MPTLHESRRPKFEDFLRWVAKHISGDEKGEAQIFLDRLFRAFEQDGFKEAGATCEMRVKKADNKGTAFADLVWKPIVLIEMKKRGENLERHYRQAFDYWTRLVPGRPRYAVLCNFDEFWIYDFETQMDTPVDKISLADLPERYGPLSFLFPPHIGWYAAKAARLKNEVDYNYSTESVFDTYPWPQGPTRKQVDAIAGAAVELRRLRAASLPMRGGLRGLYSSLALPGANPLKDAHASLDSAVLDAYGFPPGRDVLSQLFILNSEIANRIKKGSTVTSPGVPPAYPEPSRITTDDCIKPPTA